MTQHSDSMHPVARWLLVLALAGLAGACAEPTAETPSAEAVPEANVEGEETRDVYEVRGEIAAVPKAGDDERTLSIRHEAIDDYKGVGGEIWGMDSMTMPFPVADAVPIDDLSAGDKVKFTLSVAWFADEPVQITAIEAIDPGTELEFRKAQLENAAATAESGEGDEHAKGHDGHE